MSNHSSDSLGILGLVACVIVFVLARQFFPSLAKAMLVTAVVVVVLVVVLVAVVLYFAFRKPDKGNPTKTTMAKETLAQGRTSLMELRRLSMSVKNREIRTLSTDICGQADMIMTTLREKTDQVLDLRQFFNYYIPTLRSILIKYSRLEQSGVPAGEITESAVSCLGDIKSAMIKQYNNLFEDDILDLSVEMEALTLACKRDGLLTEEDFRLREGETDITLTL